MPIGAATLAWALPAAATVLSGLFGYKSAQEQGESAQKATEQQLQFQREALAEQRRRYEEGIQRLAPYSAAGKQGLIALQDLLFGKRLNPYREGISLPNVPYGPVKKPPTGLGNIPLAAMAQSPGMTLQPQYMPTQSSVGVPRLGNRAIAESRRLPDGRIINKYSDGTIGF